mgnify:FL=1
MPLETRPWDTAEFLNSPEMREAFWQELLVDFEETGDRDTMRRGLDALQRSLSMHGASFGDELIQSAREALAIAKGVIAPAARSDQSGL